MKCRICASECPPGAKICRDCAAARKRAFAATVTQPLLAAVGAPSVSQARFAPRPARSRTARPPAAARSDTAAAAPATEGRSAAAVGRGRWLLLGAAIVIAVVVVVVKLVAPEHERGPAERTGQEPGPATMAAPSAAEATFQAPVAGAVQSEHRSVPAARSSGPDEVAPKKAAHKTGARKPPASVEPPVVPAEPPAPPKAEAVVQAPRAPAPRVVEAPRDPWQTMNEGLARCAREDFFSRPDCEQKLRLRYCVNYWGTVPQCPIGRDPDHGQ